MDLLKSVRFQIQGVVGSAVFASYEAPEHLADSIGDVINGPMSGFCQGIILGMAMGQNYEVDEAEDIYLQGMGMLPGLIINVPKRCEFDDSPRFDDAVAMPTASPVVSPERDRLLNEGAKMGVSAVISLLDTLSANRTIPVGAVAV